MGFNCKHEIRKVDVNDLLRISDAASTAFGAIELPADGPQAVRFFFQGVG